MATKKKKRGRKKEWIKKAILEAAATCKTKKEFREKFPSAYVAASREGWIDQIKLPTHTTARWNKERVQSEASKCSSPTEFRQKFPSAYVIARKKGWKLEYKK